MKFMVGFILVTVYDTVLTLIGLGRGHEEGNALIANMMSLLGDIGGIIVIKLLAIGLMCLGFYVLRAHPRLVRSLVLVVTLATFLGASMWFVKF
jgi:hypothetical protein